MVCLQAEFPAIWAEIPESIIALGVHAGANAYRGEKRLPPGTPVPVSNGSDPQARLARAVQIMLGRCLQQGDIKYHCTKAEDGRDAMEATCTISCFDAENPHVFSGSAEGSTKQSKKGAVNMAAEAALETFPCGEDEGASSSEPPMKKARIQRLPLSDGSLPRPGAHVNDTGGTDAKSQLNQGIQIVVERSLTKADIVYEVAEMNGQAVATVTLNCLDTPQSFQGPPVQIMGCRDPKKQAEFGAATIALQEFQELIDMKRPEHEARKAEKAQSALEMRKKKKEELQAEGVLPP